MANVKVSELPAATLLTGSERVLLNQGGVTKTAAASSLFGGGTSGVDWFNLKDYGAVGDGVTDDSTALQTAIAAVTTNGGTLYIPPGTYLHQSPITINNIQRPWRITGDGGWQHQNAALTSLVYTGGAGTGPAWAVHSTLGFEIDHLRFANNNAAFDGVQLDIDWGSPALDPLLWSVHQCGFASLVASSATAGIRLNHAIIGRITQ